MSEENKIYTDGTGNGYADNSPQRETETAQQSADYGTGQSTAYGTQQSADYGAGQSTAYGTQQSADYGTGQSTSSYGTQQSANYGSGSYEQPRFYQNGETEWKPGNNGYGSYGDVGNSGGANAPRKKKKKSGLAVAAACILAILIIAAGSWYAVDKYGISLADQEKEEGDSSNVHSDVKVGTTETTTGNNLTLSMSDSADDTAGSGGIYLTDVSEVVENVMPAIVAITSTTLIESGNYGPWYRGDDYYQVGAGSGIIIQQSDTELLILTNNHVVEGATSLEVQFVDDTTAEATVKGTSSDNDIAVVSVSLSDLSEDTLNNILVAAIGNSDDLKVGQGIIAIGNALGYGQSVTVGVVSALNREVTIDDVTIEMIQIDAAINGGNSGGALLNSRGEVVGINSAKLSSYGSSTSASIEGMGYAIPITDVIEVIENLMNRETRYKVAEENRGYLGITGGSVTSEMVAYGYPAGFYITEVKEGGAADEAGIQEYDIVTAFEGTSVSSYDELTSIMEYYAYGETVTVTVSRYDSNTRSFEEMDFDVTLCASTAE